MTKSRKFVHLHAHSTFSFLDGFGTPEQISERIVDLGHDRVAITDHGTSHSHVPYAMTFPKHGITPIFGVEMYIVDDVSIKTRYQESLGVNAIPHITILARDFEGYKNLVRLSKLSWSEGFYYKPRIDWAQLREHQQGLVVLSGCPGGYPTRILLSDGATEPVADLPYVTSNGFDKAIKFFKKRRNEIEHFYVELVPEPGLDISHATADSLVEISRQLQIPLVLTSDAHFPREEDHHYQDILLCAGMGKRLNDETRQVKLPSYQYYCTREELFDRARRVCSRDKVSDEELGTALDNSHSIASWCNVELPKGKLVAFPDLPVNTTSTQLLWKWVSEGLVNRSKEGLIPQDLFKTYYDRAVHEFNTLDRKKYCDYVLATADVVRWVKDRSGLVMVRGSAGGCLLLWLVGASETDPIKHNLSFERFYDDNRPDPPDVDVDFEQGWRDQAIDYVFEKYGIDHCAQVAALSRLTARAALQDTAKVLGIPRSDFMRLSHALNSKDDNVQGQYLAIKDKTVLDVLKKHPELNAYERLIGQYRHSSVHAAGVIVSSTPLSDIIGVILSSDKTRMVATVDKHGAAELGLLKMDLLSVGALDVIANAARSARGSIEWLYSLPLDDQKSLDLARDGYLSEIFQLDGASAARVAREIQVSSFEDLVAASALCRPGPADWVSTYQDHKLNAGKFRHYLEAMNPTAAEIVKSTYGIILYQEQVMRFAREVAGFDWPSVHKLRKGVTSSSGGDFMKQWQKSFIDGAKETCSMQETEAEFWWQSILTHGSYSFNRSHCVTYAIIGYWGLFLKAHYPDQFYQSAMSGAGEYGMKRLVNEYRSRGGQVRLFDHEKPTSKFRVEGGVMTGSIGAIKGMGPKFTEKLVSKGPYKEPDEFYSNLPKNVATKLMRAGLHGWDPCILIPMAEWFPVTCFGPGDVEIGSRYTRVTIAQLTAQPMLDGDVQLVGYASFKSKDEDRLRFVLEDPTGALLVRVAAKRVRELANMFQEVEIGDFVAVVGWWSGDALFMRAVQVLRRDGGNENS